MKVDLAKDTVVIKLGGSMISKNKDVLFDFNYLAALKKLLINLGKEKQLKYFVVLGGGYLMRMYRDLAKDAGLYATQELHWIGTTVNVLHGEIVRAFFHEYADEGVFKYEDYYQTTPLKIEKMFKIGGGGRPGHSGDMDALLAAQRFGSSYVISLKNVDAVYDKDPNKDDTAQVVSQLSWDRYFEIIGEKTKHEPGGNYPIDPVSAHKAQEHGTTFVVVGGENLDNINHLLSGKEFHGSVVG